MQLDEMNTKNTEELAFWVDKWDKQIRELGYWDHTLSSNPIFDYSEAREREAEQHAKRILKMVGLEDGFLKSKIVLDIGAGPVCALEHSGAAQGYVVDPCSKLYRDAGLLIEGATEVTYFNCGAEEIPLPESSIDTVIAFNCLDHVDNLEKTMSEVSRVLKQNGDFLVNIELDHEPTECEPIQITLEYWGNLTKAVFLAEVYSEIFDPKGSRSEDAYMHHGSRWLRAHYKLLQ